MIERKEGSALSGADLDEKSEEAEELIQLREAVASLKNFDSSFDLIEEKELTKECIKPLNNLKKIVERVEAEIKIEKSQDELLKCVSSIKKEFGDFISLHKKDSEDKFYQALINAAGIFVVNLEAYGETKDKAIKDECLKAVIEDAKDFLNTLES